MKEYKILTQGEMFGLGLTGYSDPANDANKKKAETMLNNFAKDGWRVVTATSYHYCVRCYPAMIILERDVDGSRKDC